MDWIIDPQVWASLLTLTVLEIVLGIDNLVFIAILAGRLPAEQQNRARQIGLALALLTRLALLASITWIIGLNQPLFDLFGHPVSWRDIVLIAGGLFLLYKGTREIHHALEGDGLDAEEPANARMSFAGVVTQIMLFDVVFSLDSVITAVGMANTLWVMASAIIIAVVIMLVASRPLANFVQCYPTVKMLALSFLMLIGMTLISDGAGFHVPKGYIYAAIGFSVGVEALNQFAARRRRPREGNRSVQSLKRAGASANAAESKPFMTRTDLRVMYTALGFMAATLKGEKLPKNDAALRATVFARLIEEFCLASVPEAITDEEANAASTPDDTAERMATAIVQLIKQNGGCLPQDLLGKDFPWAMLNATGSWPKRSPMSN